MPDLQAEPALQRLLKNFYLSAVYLRITMKNYLLFLLLPVALTGCGQAGPLYLPGTPPPIHVEPEPAPKPEAKPVQKTPNNPPAEPEKAK